MAAMLRSRQLAAGQLYRTPSCPGTSLAGISLNASLQLHSTAQSRTCTIFWQFGGAVGRETLLLGISAL